jgi:hypothetical protein
MASSLPIPAPPRTPTPPTPIPWDDSSGLNINGLPQIVNSTVSFDPNALSPMTGASPGRFGSMDSTMPSPAASSSTSTNSDGTLPLPAGKSPFNFQTQTYSASPAVTKSVSRLSSLVGDLLLTLAEHGATARAQIQAQ